MHVLSLFKRLKHIHFLVIKTFIKVFIGLDQIFLSHVNEIKDLFKDSFDTIS